MMRSLKKILKKENEMTKIEEYQNKKATLETELGNLNRDIIITEQSIKTQEELFQQQFGTTDVTELQKIADTYTQTIFEKEQELATLDQV